MLLPLRLRVYGSVLWIAFVKLTDPLTKLLHPINSMKLLYRTSTCLLIAVHLIIAVNLLGCENSPEPWTDLTPDEEMSGWEIRNGQASYTVQEGVVVGTTTANTPNTFLCTRKEYADFILEFEVLVDPSINSGVQFRSHSRPDYNKGQIHGYQAEIDPSPRAWSGGIYEEGKRGWIYNLEQNAKGRTAFKNGQWNHYRIEAIGNEIAIWVNGINTANLVDDAETSGLIGLQVHSIPHDSLAGKHIKWRRIRIMENPENQYRTETTAPLIGK